MSRCRQAWRGSRLKRGYRQSSRRQHLLGQIHGKLVHGLDLSVGLAVIQDQPEFGGQAADPDRFHRLPPVGLQAVIVELEGMARRGATIDEPPRAPPSHLSSPLPELGFAQNLEKVQRQGKLA